MVTRGVEIGHTCGVAGCRLDIWNDCLLRLAGSYASVGVLALGTCIHDDRSGLINDWLCDMLVKAVAALRIRNLI